MTAAILSVLNEGTDLTSWNKTLITLIPKVRNPLMIKEYRPISLCNTCYKIISKTITNRLRPVLFEIIDPHHSAFIPGRLITDNVMIGIECMHWLCSS